MTEPPAPIRLLIVDDHLLVARSLERLLGDEEGVEVVGIATTADEAIASVDEAHPDVVVLDYELPDRDGVTATVEIKRRAPDVQVVMLTGHADDHTLVKAIDAGCSGFLTKDRAADELLAAVRAANAGEALISPTQLSRLLPLLSGRTQRPGHDLTDREHEVLQQLATGATNKQIAAQLHLSVNTVRNYVQYILNKLGAHSKLEAVSIAVREGIIDYPGR